MLYGRWIVYATVKESGEDLSNEEVDILLDEKIEEIRKHLEATPGLIEIDFEGTEVG